MVKITTGSRDENAYKTQPSFSTRFDEMRQNHQATLYGSKDVHRDSSVISRLSQQPQQNMPEFPQIDQTDGVENFINGFEKFTQQIENYLETKDEQMQILIQNRRL